MMNLAIRETNYDPNAELPDYCAACVRSGRRRAEVITLPVNVYRSDPLTLTAWYRCDHGHTWTCCWLALTTDDEMEMIR